MKVLVIGSGGREHALVWKLAQSTKVRKIFCAPGNAGISTIAECINIKPDNIEDLLTFAKYEAVDLTVIGPELPLTLGIVDAFEKERLRIFGPNRRASQIEGSKAFAKELMRRYGVPTAEFRVFSSIREAEEYIRLKGAPIVVKADGLAAGKGVIVANTVDDAINTLRLIMKERVFGEAGNRVVIEEHLQGEEASFMVFTDGKTILPMASSQDHKRLYDNDEGPNTGGMGAYSPAPVVTRRLEKKIMNNIMAPVIRGLRSEGINYKGVLYAGLMISDGEPIVLEFNARFGDPEIQPVIVKMKSDIVPVLESVVEERLSEVDIEWDTRAAVCVVMASEGYPGKYRKGDIIEGLSESIKLDNVIVFHAGTEIKDGEFVTAGGRVLGVTSLGMGIKTAIENTYKAVSKIKWEGVHYRKDIGRKGLRIKD
ncbi:MAG: phosphoribosylamine--glycine ligase [Nitrospirota bacterium]